jgi:hypothetical protein
MRACLFSRLKPKAQLMDYLDLQQIGCDAYNITTPIYIYGRAPFRALKVLFRDIKELNKIKHNCYFKEKSMTISSPEREAKKVKIAVDRNPVETSFEKWACDLK